MRTYFSSLPRLSILTIITVVMALAAITPETTLSKANGGAEQARPVVFTTPAKKIRLTLSQKPDAKSLPPIRLRAAASLTLIEANADDTLRCLLVLTLDKSERDRLSRRYGNAQTDCPDCPDWKTLPETLGRRELRLGWVKGTACPDLDLELPAFNLDYQGRKLEVDAFRFKIDIDQETVETIPQLLCGWTRQINTGRPHLGIIMAINRLLLPEEQP
jgi:hypothetical protein